MRIIPKMTVLFLLSSLLIQTLTPHHKHKTSPKFFFFEIPKGPPEWVRMGFLRNTLNNFIFVYLLRLPQSNVLLISNSMGTLTTRRAPGRDLGADVCWINKSFYKSACLRNGFQFAALSWDTVDIVVGGINSYILLLSGCYFYLLPCDFIIWIFFICLLSN